MSKRAIGQRRTPQRDVIHQVIRDAPGPMTVEEILAEAQDQIDGMGIATVYRTVKLLVEAGQVHTVILPDGQSRYEAADLGHHHHFRCRVCERVFDLDICPVHLPKGSLPKGFVVEDHELTLHGTCPECRKS